MTEQKTVRLISAVQRSRILKMGYNKSATDGSKIPAIRFSGQYLESLGFHHNGKFMMTINDDMTITLKAIEKESENESSGEIE